MDMQYASVALELKRAPDDAGVFEGYASVFNVIDQGMDSVQPGAFSKTLGRRKVKMLWQHDTSQPIGVWEEIREDEKGLYVKGRCLPDVRKGAEAIALMKAGALDSMSIGYRTMDAETSEENRHVRKLLEVDLFEISLVTFPMLPDAKITNVKSIRTIREFEKALRDVGFSQKEAKAIAADGFKGLANHRDDVEAEPDTEGVKSLISAIGQLKETFNVR
jgi:HK97 family phage prohead protease